ncbi:MAG: TonB-dependent receptor [Betaproteobacteria bacterium]
MGNISLTIAVLQALRGKWPATALLCLSVLAAPIAAASPLYLSAPEDLAELSLEQLGNILVTTVSKREEKLSSANAAIFVITSEDIRRSGATTLPEVLRMAPNLDVARADTNTYAISARGFNTLTANNMLVLVDGRAVYSILYSGVFWEAQQVMLEDVERIEVISGPSTTLWGANAVNGVINIITRSARDTQGTLVAGGGGNRESGGAVRYGGEAGGAQYRVYGRYTDFNNASRAGGIAIRDSAHTAQAGFRADWGSLQDGFTLQGDYYRSDIDQFPQGREITGANLLGRWQRQLADGSRLRVQGYFDRAERDIPTQYHDVIDTWDFDFQHVLAPGTVHNFIWGGGNRLARDRFTGSPALMFIPGDRALHLSNIFAQDSIALPHNTEITAGVKLEHNSYTGTEFMPNLRLTWRPSPDLTLWTSLSRALRTPSRLDREYSTPAFAGNANYESEITNVIEAGFRSQPMAGFSYSVTAFHNMHDRIRSIESGITRLVLGNGIEGTTTGAGAWGNYQAARNWRLSAGAAWQHLSLQRKAGSLDAGLGVTAAGNDPRHWASLRSLWDITPQFELDVTVRHVGARPSPVVPSYTAADVRLGWHISRALELSLTLRSANEEEHTEWGAPANRAVFERNAFVKLVWRP